MLLNRRNMLVLSGTSLALAACGQSGASGNAGVLRVGSQRGSTKALLTASGALDGTGYTVEWSEFPAAQPLLEAIGSGAVDVGVAGDAPFLFAFQSGSPIKAVQAQTALERPTQSLGILVPAASPVQSIADLKGKRIATTRGSIGHYLVLRALAAGKLPPDYVQITYLAPSDAKAALQTGAVEAWSVWVPYITVAITDGYRVLVDGHSLLTGTGFDVASDAAIAGKRDMLKDYLAREAKALLWAKAHVDDYARVLAKDTGLPFTVAREMSLRNSRVAVPFTPALVADQQTVVDTFRTAGELKAIRPIKDAYLTV